MDQAIADGTRLQEHAMRVAAELPQATLSHPFGIEYDVYKVVGKVFLMATEVPGEPVVTMKCDPGHAEALREQFSTITPGYHMNKRHWISVGAGPGISPDLVTELVTEAYLLVVETLPRYRRPVLPDRLSAC